MDRKHFDIEGLEVDLYHKEAGGSSEKGSPLIILNSFNGDGHEFAEKLTELTDSGFDLASINVSDWDRDMSPWECPAIFKGESGFAGGADEYLVKLTESILPVVRETIGNEPLFTGICGYSMGGLFALYSLYKTDLFDCAGSMSGSLWFPGFREFVMSHEMAKPVKGIYLSLGDKEARTRNEYMKTVQENTEAIYEYYKGLGIETKYELNPGNHFRDPELRTAKGIAWLLK